MASKIPTCHTLLGHHPPKDIAEQVYFILWGVPGKLSGINEHEWDMLRLAGKQWVLLVADLPTAHHGRAACYRVTQELRHFNQTGLHTTGTWHAGAQI
jgi:hypothetical protein